jgi:FdhD protein
MNQTMTDLTKTTTEYQIVKKRGHEKKAVKDLIAIENPLQIEVNNKAVSITMRTPGDDAALAIGFLFTEAMIRDYNSVDIVQQKENDIISVNILPEYNINTKSLERNFYTTSSCGVCGKASVDAIRNQSQYSSKTNASTINEEVLFSLQDKLLNVQSSFEATGGLHAAALFNTEGRFLYHSEDVGRHNALDKLIGHALIAERIPLENHVLLLSGRASFELIQKASMAGIAIVVAVGAPSSLAIDLSKESGMTLVGFMKKNGYNIYCGEQRIKG